MRVEISHKFILGFITVVASIVLINMVVPHLQIPAEWQQLFTLGCAMLVGLVLGSLFSRVFTKNIRSLQQGAQCLSQGDLSRDVRLPDTFFPDETTDLAAALNEVTAKLRELVGYIRNVSATVAQSAHSLSATSQEVTASSQEVAKTVEQISYGAETQAEMTERSTRLIREMAISIDLIASSARKLTASASDTAQTAQEGGELSRVALEKMKLLMVEVEKSGGLIVSFGGQVQKIGKIVEVITNIAQKTNLLSLNASIEAARAGEYGRGFAVVAEEIRKLADSTSLSASEITELVEAIREESQKIQTSMHGTMRELSAGRSSLDTTGSAFEKIINTALITQTKATSISELSHSQAEGARHMVTAIEEISRVVTDNAAATEELSAVTEEQTASMAEMALSAQQLSALAEELVGMVQRFRLERQEA
jgi:methyl-accepting chemotaxis protein